MQLTIKIKMLPTREQTHLLKATTAEYIRLVNQMASDEGKAETLAKHTSKTVVANLPSALKNQAIRDAKKIDRKYRITKVQSVLRKPVAIWNNQNWSLKENILTFPVMVDGKSQRLAVPVLLTDYQKEKQVGKRGTLRITEKSGKWMAQIAVDVPEAEAVGNSVMGVDLGLKVPAVAVTDTGKTRFLGNGRQNKYKKRKFRSKRRKLGKLKKLSVIRKLNDKEQRWMKDQDHKVSRKIVNLAIEEKVGVIRLEQLSGIRQTARTSRKNEKNLHSWSFYRLAQFILYKAVMAGIRVELVNPRHTSQTCPACGKRNKARDRQYRCECGYRGHRDRVGAVNIMNAPVTDGNSLSA